MLVKTLFTLISCKYNYNVTVSVRYSINNFSDVYIYALLVQIEPACTINKRTISLSIDRYDRFQIY